MWILAWIAVALAAPLTVEVNHAFVKGQPIPGATLEVGPHPNDVPSVIVDAGPDGRAVIELDPGTWYVRTRVPGFVELPPAPVELPEAGRTVTLTLTPLLEAVSGSEPRRHRVQIVLNWGSDPSQVRDVDAHLVCIDGTEVYFAMRDHSQSGHSVDLDVDDVDWGGPETITLWDPPVGEYTYFVRNFSGPGASLGASDVVVRVLDDDHVLGAYRVPPDLDFEDWLPFRAIEVTDAGTRVVPFTPQQLADGADRSSRAPFRLSGLGWLGALLFAVMFPVAFLAILFFVRLRR